jgi:hypothetical protein
MVQRIEQDWPEAVRTASARYDEALLRQVAGKLFRPRNQWPAAELVKRLIDALANAAIIDRRIAELSEAGRTILALVSASRQSHWRAIALVELMATLDANAGIEVVKELLSAGLAFPSLSHDSEEVHGFESWLTRSSNGEPWLFVPGSVAARATNLSVNWPVLPVCESNGPAEEADGLDWFLRLAATWQTLKAGSLRRTHQGTLFKRDYDRLSTDPRLNGPGTQEAPDSFFMSIELALLTGLAEEDQAEYRAGEFPETWQQGLAAALTSVWTCLPQADSWDPSPADEKAPPNPYLTASFLVLRLLGALDGSAWVRCKDIEDWFQMRHPLWRSRTPNARGHKSAPRSSWFAAYANDIAWPLCLLRRSRDEDGEMAVSLSETGRWLLRLGPEPKKPAVHAKTLLVQPNLEVVVYRQGLTPGLIASLSCFADWKAFGAACTMQLDASSAYRALELGWSFERIVQALEQHSTRPLPVAVVESLRTWSNKRDRLSVYRQAALLEFNTAADLHEALGRGVPGVRVADRLLAVADDSVIDYRHFRLSGTRDYRLPPDPCVSVEDDGVTLTVDVGRSDLLLDSTLERFTEPIERSSHLDRKQYRITSSTLERGRAGGLTLTSLEEWFAERTGRSIPAAVRLLMSAGQLPAPRLEQEFVIHVETKDIADGLMQWPPTRDLIRQRLGPTTVAIARENVEPMRQRLAEAGIPLTIAGN